DRARCTPVTSWPASAARAAATAESTPPDMAASTRKVITPPGYALYRARPAPRPPPTGPGPRRAPAPPQATPASPPAGGEARSASLAGTAASRAGPGARRSPGRPVAPSPPLSHPPLPWRGAFGALSRPPPGSAKIGACLCSAAAVPRRPNPPPASTPSGRTGPSCAAPWRSRSTPAPRCPRRPPSGSPGSSGASTPPWAGRSRPPRRPAATRWRTCSPRWTPIRASCWPGSPSWTTRVHCSAGTARPMRRRSAPGRATGRGSPPRGGPAPPRAGPDDEARIAAERWSRAAPEEPAWAFRPSLPADHEALSRPLDWNGHELDLAHTSVELRADPRRGTLTAGVYHPDFMFLPEEDQAGVAEHVVLLALGEDDYVRAIGAVRALVEKPLDPLPPTSIPSVAHQLGHGSGGALVSAEA